MSDQDQEQHTHSFEKKELSSPFSEDDSEESSGQPGSTDEKDPKQQKDDSEAEREDGSKEESKPKEVEEEDKEEKETKSDRVKNKEEIDKELREIYENKDGEVPDMSNFNTKNSNSMLRAFTIFLFSLLFLAGVAWLGFFFFQPQDRFSEDKVVFSIESPQEVKIGEEVHYRIKYQNRQNVPLSKANINVRYPEGFVFERAEPEPTEGDNSWKLGTVEKISADYIDIYGKLYGDIKQKQSLRAFLNYTPANFSSPFQKVATFDTEISSSPLSASVSGPDKLAVGEKGEWNINVTSNQTQPVENLRVRIKAGNNFRFTDRTPAATNTPENIWQIDKLKDKKEFSFSGVFESKKEDNRIKLEVLGQKEKPEDELQPDRYLFARSEQKVALSETSLNFSLAINGALGNFSVRPGEALNTTLKIENNGKEPVKDAEVKMVFDAPSNDRQAILERSILHWSEIKNVGTENIVGDQINDNVRRGTITWDTNSTPDLSEIKPGESVELSFTLPVKSSEIIDLTEFDTYTTKAKADLKYKIDDKVETVSTNKFDITMNSDLNIDVTDTVTENDDGEKVHNVAWVLDNNFHKVENVRVEADIFGDIEWKEDALNTTTGTAKFDQENQHLTWSIDQMPANAQPQTLNFATILKEYDPTQTNLTSRVKVKARDTKTGEEVIISGDEVLLQSATSTIENTP
ncbi:MAG: hypothetical protein ABEJ02_02665 [Candidatus Paceibacteria bacterium]